jgi:hypothetical protein
MMSLFGAATMVHLLLASAGHPGELRHRVNQLFVVGSVLALADSSCALPNPHEGLPQARPDRDQH